MTGIDSPDIALGYAVAYPLGVIGIILSMMVLRRVFRIDFAKEEKKALDTMDVQHDSVAATPFAQRRESGAGRQKHS